MVCVFFLKTTTRHAGSGIFSVIGANGGMNMMMVVEFLTSTWIYFGSGFFWLGQKRTKKKTSKVAAGYGMEFV